MIRIAIESDVPRIFKLLKEMLLLHKGMYPDRFSSIESKYNFEEVLMLVLDKKIFIYELEGFLIGYLIGWIDGEVYFVDDLMVDGNYRKQGIGSDLLEHATLYARELGCKEVHLNVWSNNISALAFYEALDFKVLKYRMYKKI